MSKRSIVKKDVLTFVQNELEAGKTKSEIFEELSARYFDSKTLAQYVAGVPDPDLKQRYKSANTLLFVLLILAGIFKVMSVVAMIAETTRSPFVFLLSALVPLVNIWLAIEVKNRRGYIYWVIIALAFISMMRSLEGVLTHGAWVLVDITLLVAIAGLSWYVGTKMFPKLRFGQPVKDAQGAYRF